MPPFSSTTLVTTSWDDGHPLDLRIADMLAKYGLSGTFFVPLCNPHRPRLSDVDMRELTASGFEVGSHGMRHQNLAKTPRSDLRWEIRDSKTELQQIIGRDINTFCYPMGRINPQVVREVSSAGYLGARTTQMLSTRVDFNPLRMPTTIQAYRHTPGEYVKNLVRRGDVKNVLRYAASLSKSPSWVNLGKCLFDRTLRKGGIWHLYGHSWEIEQYDLWAELAEMLAYVSGREGVRYVRVVDTLPSRASECLSGVACPQVLSQ